MATHKAWGAPEIIKAQAELLGAGIQGLTCSPQPMRPNVTEEELTMSDQLHQPNLRELSSLLFLQ